MKLLFVVPYPRKRAPSQRLKFEQYFSYFEERGVKITFSAFMTEGLYDIAYSPGRHFKKAILVLFGYLRRLRDFVLVFFCDIVYLHLESAPFGPAIFERFCCLLGKPIIYDIDDLVYLNPPKKVNKLINILRNRNKVKFIAGISKHVIVCTEYLKEYVSAVNKNVTNISSTIDTEKYKVKASSCGKKIVVGWSGSRSTSFYLHLLDGVIRRLQDAFDIVVKVIGDKNFRISGVDVCSIPWREETEVRDLQEIDIGLYPLKKDTWMLGKSSLKALQYMGLGIPVVVQACGTNLTIIVDGVNGFLADSEEEWLEKITRLIKDPELRMRIGMAGRETVESKFSVKINAPKYMEIIEGVYKAYC